MKQFKKFLLTITVILLFAILTATLCAGLVLSPVYEDVFTAEPNTQLPINVAKNALTSSACTISENELNSFAAYLISTTENIDTGDFFRLTDIYIDMNASLPSKCYMRISNGTFTLIVTADCSITYGNEITMSFSNVTIGKLPISDNIAARFFEDIDLGDAENYTHKSTLAISFPTHYGIEVPVLGEIVDIDIESLEISDDCIYITTNKIIGDSMQNAFDSIVDYFFSP